LLFDEFNRKLTIRIFFHNDTTLGADRGTWTNHAVSFLCEPQLEDKWQQK
jgi:hypothetical protein